LFSENGGYVIATHNVDQVKNICEQSNVFYQNLGKTNQTNELKIKTESEQLAWPLDMISNQWNQYNP